MTITPLLERLLLSNEAVFKNATLGMSSQNMVFVPPGKTAVILEVSINSFINNVSADFMQFLTQGWNEISGGDICAEYSAAIRRFHYQLQIINDNYQTYINLADQLNLNVNAGTDGLGMRPFPTATLEFKEKREELFIYTDRSLYFNIIYPYKQNEVGPDTPGLTPSYTTPSVGFLPKIQNLPVTPITFNQNILVDYVANVTVISTTNDRYYPVNHQTNPAFSAEFPQQEYLRYLNGVNETNVIQPVAPGTELFFHDLLSIPFINVKYALLNKRPADYGIAMPPIK
jgi:hypothetical protein